VLINKNFVLKKQKLIFILCLYSAWFFPSVLAPLKLPCDLEYAEQSPEWGHLLYEKVDGNDLIGWRPFPRFHDPLHQRMESGLFDSF